MSSVSSASSSIFHPQFLNTNKKLKNPQAVQKKFEDNFAKSLNGSEKAYYIDGILSSEEITVLHGIPSKTILESQYI